MSIRKVFIKATLILIATTMAACSDAADPIEVTRVVEEATTPPTSESFREPFEGDPTLTPIPTSTPKIIIVDGHDIGPPVVDDRVTFNGYLTRDIPTLDPQLSDDAVSQNYVENLFVQLTNFDLSTNEIVPEAATSWEISEDGRLYTFHLRTDIPWVYHNPVTEETTGEIDKEDKPRFVTAYDFAYGIRRACDPAVESYYGQVIAPLIVGCEAVLNAEDPNAVSEDLMSAIGVEVVDEATLIIELNEPASYFLSMTPMPIFSAVPSWTIEEYGEEWIENGYIVTNGRYVLNTWVHNIYVELLHNPLIPMNLRGIGNIEKHVSNVVPRNETGYELWLQNEFDISLVPEDELETHLVEYADQTLQIPDSTHYFIVFHMDKAPFDNVHVRRAFSAAFDRDEFSSYWRQGQGLPMKHLAPPGIFGAPPLDEIGVGFNPEFARAELSAAGYPNCEDFPPITLTAYTGQTTLLWAEFAQEQWQEHLGCTSEQILFEQPTITFLEPRPSFEEISESEEHHFFTNGWGMQYPDENNWVGDLLSCNSGSARTKRPCNDIDDLIIEAGQEPNPERRIQLYAQIEEAFFGPEGEFPLIPIWSRTYFRAVHSWYDYTPSIFGGDQWYNYSIDKDAKQAAQE